MNRYEKMGQYEILIDFTTRPYPVILWRSYSEEKTVRGLVIQFLKSKYDKMPNFMIYRTINMFYIGKVYDSEIKDYGLETIEINYLDRRPDLKPIYKGKTYDGILRVESARLNGIYQYKRGRWHKI